MGVTLANNAHTTLSADATSTDTVFYVEDIDSFPTLNFGDYFYCTIERTSGAQEIVKVTQINSSSFIVERGQEDTIPISFPIGSLVELRMTVQNITDLIVTGENVEDEAFGVSWNGDVDNAASRNALYDKITTIDSTLTTHTGQIEQLQDTAPVTPFDFGAVGNGVADDTTAIDDANTFAVANNRPLHFPGGYTFVYNGDGLAGASMHIIGDGISQSIIVLGADKYLVDDSGLWGSFYMNGLRIINGAGAVRNTYTSPMVQLTFQVNDCYFYGYTGPCISNNSSDSPHWHIENCVFWGDNSTTCIGVALKGLTDSNFIQHNSFRTNKVHIKIGDGGNNAYVAYNDFLQYGAGTGRHDIWVVPDADGTNAGTGLIVSCNKFGNESSDASDFMVSYADEGAGTYFGDRLPDMGTNSTGYIKGHSFTNNAIYSDTGTPYQPFVKSMTKRVFGCQYGSLTIGGTPPTYVIEFSQTPDALTTEVYWNVVGPILSDGSDDLTGFAPASSYNNVKVIDPTGAFVPATQSAFVRTSNLGSGVLTFLGTPSSANLAAIVSDETGSGALVLATSPSFVTPDLGTPSAGTLTNCTGLPVTTGVSGLGSNVATMLATPTAANFAAAVPYITHGTWTPALTFATPGDLSVTAAVATGFYTQIGVAGAGVIIASFNYTTSAFTHTTASGALQITGLPAAQAVASGILPFGTGRFQGITKTNYTQFLATVASGAQIVTFVASGSGQGNSTVIHSDLPSGGTVNLAFNIVYRI